LKKIPDVLVAEMRREMDTLRVPRLEQVECFKWLRYYLDFCLKYRHSTRDPDTEVLYLQKLSSKGQSGNAQEQASRTITLFREVAKRFPAKGKEQDQTDHLSDWGQVLVSMEEVIRLRQYARATSKTYRHWVIQFQNFLGHKPVDQVNDEDAVRFLTWLAAHKHVVSTTQNQAFNALLFLFRHVLKRPYELGDKVQRARRTRYVLIPTEFDLAHFPEPQRGGRIPAPRIARGLRAKIGVRSEGPPHPRRAWMQACGREMRRSFRPSHPVYTDPARCAGLRCFCPFGA